MAKIRKFKQVQYSKRSTTVYYKVDGLAALKSNKELDNKVGEIHKFSIYEGINDKMLDKIRKESYVNVGSHVFRLTKNGEGQDFVPSGEVTINFRNSAKKSTCIEAIKKQGLEIKKIDTKYNAYLCTVTKKSVNPIKVQDELNKIPCVILAEADMVTVATRYSDKFEPEKVPMFTKQWHLHFDEKDVEKGGKYYYQRHLIKANSHMNVLKAWRFIKGYGNKSIVTVVVDDNFDLFHNDLLVDEKGTRIVGVLNADSGEKWIRKDNKKISQKAIDIVSPKQNDWHGTSCAGILGAKGEKDGSLGVFPNTKLAFVSLKYIRGASIENLVNFVEELNADIVSCSWGVADSNFVLPTRMDNAITRMTTKGRNGKGVIVCFAAGNSNREVGRGFAGHKNVVCVGASTSNQTRSSYSNYGKSLSVNAPSNGNGGLGVFATDVTRVCDDFTLLCHSNAGYNSNPGPNGRFTVNFGGTSASCPMVAGVAGLILSVNPNLASEEVIFIMEKTAKKIGEKGNYDYNGHSIHYGYGRVDAYAAVKYTYDLLHSKKEKPKPITQPSINPNVITIGEKMLFELKPNQTAFLEALEVMSGRYEFQLANTQNIGLYMRNKGIPTRQQYNFKIEIDGNAKKVAKVFSLKTANYKITMVNNGENTCCFWLSITKA